MVAQKPEAAVLRKYGFVVIERAIFETEDEMAGDAIPLCNLCHLTVGEVLACKGTQREKAMHQAFLMAHRHLLSAQRVSQEQGGANQQDNGQPEPGTFYDCHIPK